MKHDLPAPSYTLFAILLAGLFALANWLSPVLFYLLLAVILIRLGQLCMEPKE